MRHALPVAAAVHVVDQAADIFAGQVAFQRPRRVGVAERRGHVGHVGIHHALVGQLARKIDGAAVDVDLEAAEHLQIEPGRGDDDVGVELAAVLQPDAFLSETVDLGGHDRSALVPDRLEQVAVRHQAQPLVPGIVARREMGGHVVVGTERHPDAAEDHLLDLGRLAARELEEEHAPEHVAPADHLIGEFGRQLRPQFVGDGILRRPRHHIGRRALQHGDVAGGLGHLRHQRHRRRARTDHHHALARIVDIVGPFLRMHDTAGEIRRARKFRRVAFLVSVVARTHEQEVAGEAHDLGRALARAALGLHGPARVRRRPRRPLDPVVIADLLVDAVLGRGLADVVQDPRPVGDRLGLDPRLERIAEREHVGVGADAGIAKQVPGAADGVAALEDDVALAGTFLLQVEARADSGQAGADDQHVEMFWWHRALPAAYAYARYLKDVNARDKPGHDGNSITSFRGCEASNYDVHCTSENLEIPGLVFRTIPE